MAQPLWTLCVISSENLGLNRHGSLSSTCVMLEKEPAARASERSLCAWIHLHSYVGRGVAFAP